MTSQVESNQRPEYDTVIQQIADYVLNYQPENDEAWQTARYCLMDSIGCGLLALRFPECTKHLGPLVAGTTVPDGARVPGTAARLDPMKAAWDIGCIIRWLDYNDTWLAAEWGHPSDNLGAILAVADHISQRRQRQQQPPLTMKMVLHYMIIAHEIQGILALENSFNRVGLDHVVLVKVASTAVAAALMGANREQMMSAISHAWVDGQALRTYRHAPNAGSRKSWAAGDASSRAVRLADIAMRGEMGIPSALTAPQWGFYDVLFSKTNRDQQLKPPAQRQFKLTQPFASYVMQNILFKIAFPAEFHAQTACEAAIELHPQVKQRLAGIEQITLTTHESAIRIISKEGTLANPADRDHCLQYMTVVALIFGDLKAEYYEDEFHQQHADLIDGLRERIVVKESQQYSQDYLDPDKRSIANALTITFNDGSETETIAVEYPIGHRKRREEGIPLLKDKFRHNLSTRYGAQHSQRLFDLCDDHERLSTTPVDEFMALFSTSG